MNKSLFVLAMVCMILWLPPLADAGSSEGNVPGKEFEALQQQLNLIQEIHDRYIMPKAIPKCPDGAYISGFDQDGNIICVDGTWVFDKDPLSKPELLDDDTIHILPGNRIHIIRKDGGRAGFLSAPQWLPDSP